MVGNHESSPSKSISFSTVSVKMQQCACTLVLVLSHLTLLCEYDLGQHQKSSCMFLTNDISFCSNFYTKSVTIDTVGHSRVDWNSVFKVHSGFRCMERDHSQTFPVFDHLQYVIRTWTVGRCGNEAIFTWQCSYQVWVYIFLSLSSTAQNTGTQIQQCSSCTCHHYVGRVCMA